MIPERTVGLDTSVVVRLLSGEPVEQAGRALQKLQSIWASGERVAISDIVVIEAYFALHHAYGVPKQVALDKLRDFLAHPQIVAGGQAAEILNQPRLGTAKPGFVDRLIHAQYQERDASLLTFEKAAKKLPRTEVLR